MHLHVSPAFVCSFVAAAADSIRLHTHTPMAGYASFAGVLCARANAVGFIPFRFLLVSQAIGNSNTNTYTTDRQREHVLISSLFDGANVSRVVVHHHHTQSYVLRLSS